MTNPKHTDTSRSGDLVERLRERTCVVFNSPGVHPDTECIEAADRIEALEAENARLREALELADAALRGANMNMNVVKRKVRAALKEIDNGDR